MNFYAMKKSLCILAFTALAALPGRADEPLRLTADNIDQIVQAMTPEEKVRLLIGTSMADEGEAAGWTAFARGLVPGAAGTTYPIERLGIPAIVLADGPAGVRISPHRPNDSATYYCTGFPITTMLASSWNEELLKEVGQAMGEEALAYGVDVILAPGMNIQRNPLCGRNFEYFSEDPLLCGRLAAAFIQGVQGTGTGTSVKHFAANNQEINRLSNDSRVSPRALREIYLKCFEIAVREAQPKTVMTSYNYLNGVYTSENPELLETILRDEWGFRGAVMTDWGGGLDSPAQIAAGNDMIQPGSRDRYDAILEALQTGKLSEEAVNRSVKRVLQLIVNSPHFFAPDSEADPKLQAHAEISRRAAAESMVLLKNDNEALPLKKGRIALFGTASYELVAGGTGSGDVNKAYVIDLQTGLQNAGYELDPEITAAYASHMAAERERLKPINEKRGWFLGPIRPEEIPQAEELIQHSVANADAAVITIGRICGEGTDRHIPGDFLLKESELQLIEQVSAAYHAAGKPVTVILNTGGVMETASWKEAPDAILVAWLPGQEGGNAIADVISGVCEPSGRLPMSFPIAYEDVPAQNFPALNLNTGQNDSFYRFRKTKVYEVPDVDWTDYTEDIYVGYRYYTTRKVPVSYPFGFGLGYTTFTVDRMKAKRTNDGWLVTVQVTNTGSRNGREVIQLYSEAPQGKLDKPVRELRAFAKTPILAPGESTRMSLKVKSEDLASFDEELSAWVTDPGTYRLIIGSDAETETNSCEVKVKEEIVRPVNRVLLPKGPLFIGEK